MKLKFILQACLLVVLLCGSPRLAAAAGGYEGPSQSVPGEDENLSPEPLLYPTVQSEPSLLFDPGDALSAEQRQAISQVLEEHREAGGETLKIAILRETPKTLDQKQTSERLFGEWQKDPDLLKERETLLMFFLDSRIVRVEFSYDLEHLLQGQKGARVVSIAQDALEQGTGSGVASGTLEMLRSLSSPLVEQKRIPPGLQALIVTQDRGNSNWAAMGLLFFVILCLSGFGFLLSLQEIHVSSEGAHRIRPHERIAILWNAIKKRTDRKPDEGPDAAIEGHW